MKREGLATRGVQCGTMRSRRLIATALAVVCLWAVGTDVLLGQDEGRSPESMVAAARQMQDAGKVDEAVALMREAFLEYPAHVEVNFRYGLAAAAAGDYETASMAFDRVLIMNPDLPRVRLELARSYFHLGLDSIAKESFEEVLETHPPERVRQRIEGFLAEIRKRQKRHAFSGSFVVSVSNDSNVNVASDTDEVYVPFPGTQVLIPGNAVRDQFLATTLQLCHVYRPARTAGRTWDTCLTQYNALYDDRSDLDIRYVRLATGPSFSLGRRNAGLQLRGLATYMDRGQEAYEKAFGLSALHFRSVSDEAWFQTRAVVEDRTYFDDPGEDSVNLRLEAGPVWNAGDHRFDVAGTYERNEAEDGDKAFHQVGVTSAYRYILNSRTILRLGLEYEYSDYDDTNFLYAPTVREDHGIRARIGVRRQLTGAVSANLRYQYEKSWSNVDIYDHERHVWIAAMRVSF